LTFRREVTKWPALMMTTANKITIFRILLVPFFIVQFLYYTETRVEMYRVLALVAFGLAALSDAIDGYIARRYNQRSVLGAVLDPLADKLLLVSGIVLLSFDHGSVLPRLPLWLTGIILGRDLVLVIGVALLHYLGVKVTVRPVFIGKVATVLQMVCVLWGMFKWPASWLLSWSIAAAACTAISGVMYIFTGMRQLSASPSSSASAADS
jgi:cardiolipin synthase (CMP-forming)